MSDASGMYRSRRTVTDEQTAQANRAEWDRYADDYQATHGQFLGDAKFIWSPEAVNEEEAHVLGDVNRRKTLEVGCGAAQCSRWLRTQGALVTGLDLSHRQLQHGKRLDAETGISVPVVCATATALPFTDDSFDIAFSAFGALQFVAEASTAVHEVARVLGAGGTFAFSITHPIRWSMPDDPGPDGLQVTSSYFDRTPYVEQDDDGVVMYAEHHRTLGDWVRILVEAGFAITDLLEPEWPAGHDRVWDGWGPVRGRLIPGTAIFSTTLTR